MEAETIFKWALIGAAAYLVYRYLDEQGYFASLSSSTAAPGTTGAVTAAAPSNLLSAGSGAAASAGAAAPPATSAANPATAPVATVTVAASPAPTGAAAASDGSMTYPGTLTITAPSGKSIVTPTGLVTAVPNADGSTSYGISLTAAQNNALGLAVANLFGEAPPAACQGPISNPQAAAACNAAMASRPSGGASLSGFSAAEEMDQLLEELQPYRRRWGIA
jgi:hypothetical protein